MPVEVTYMGEWWFHENLKRRGEHFEQVRIPSFQTFKAPTLLFTLDYLIGELIEDIARGMLPGDTL